MSISVINEIRKGTYIDSVALMQISRQLKELEGVKDAGLMMGTPANLQIMSEAGILSDDGKEAAPNDLVIAVSANDESIAKSALRQAENLLETPRTTGSEEEWRPKTIRSAVADYPDANLAVISVAGEYAAAEARKALRHNLNVMIFSDNVPVDEEVSIKQEAQKAGLLVMGPDCGTAIINGVPLAFANRVSEGDIGVIGASGTGIQEVTCLISRLGKGISHAIGVGGRDLSQQVGGISTLAAIDLLEEDPGTRHIVIISKPPATEVVSRLFDRIDNSQKTFTICLLGSDITDCPNNSVLVSTLKSAAEYSAGCSLSGSVLAAPEENISTSNVRYPQVELNNLSIRGLFAGGTLCAEAQLILIDHNEQVISNEPVPGSKRLDQGEGHLLLDLGADEFTRGKPHPMIDPQLRNEYIVSALDDPSVGVIVVDVVLGYGSHENPASVLVSALEDHAPQKTQIVASVCGTDQDYQGRQQQISLLEENGVIVAESNADAVLKALSIVGKNNG